MGPGLIAILGLIVGGILLALGMARPDGGMLALGFLIVAGTVVNGLRGSSSTS